MPPAGASGSRMGLTPRVELGGWLRWKPGHPARLRPRTSRADQATVAKVVQSWSAPPSPPWPGPLPAGWDEGGRDDQAGACMSRGDYARSRRSGGHRASTALAASTHSGQAFEEVGPQRWRYTMIPASSSPHRVARVLPAAVRVITACSVCGLFFLRPAGQRSSTGRYGRRCRGLPTIASTSARHQVHWYSVPWPRKSANFRSITESVAHTSQITPTRSQRGRYRSRESSAVQLACN